MSEKTEIGTKLVLDDEASETLHKVREGFEKVRDRASETGKELLGMAKQAATFALGFQLNGAIESLKEFGHELVEGASHLEMQKRELAGLIGLTDKGNASFEQLSDRAGEMSEKFEQLAISAGASKESLIDAFEMIASRSTRSAEETGAMVEKMAMAAKILPQGMEGMAGAWRDLEMGFVRPKNALVQLMRQTDVMSGSAQSIAKGLNAMIQGGQGDQVFKYAEMAIDRAARRAKDLPLTFDQLLKSLSTFREMFMETMGTPILHVLGPQFEKMRAYLESNRAELAKLAQTMGERVGEWVRQAALMIQNGFDYLRTHADDIMNALERGAGALRDAVAFMVEHRALFLGLAVARMAGNGLGSVASALPGIGGAAGSLAGAGINALKGGNAFGMTAASAGMSASEAAIAGVTASVASMAVAAGIWYVAVKQADQLEQETGMSTLDTIGHLLSFQTHLFQSVDNLQNFNATMRAFHSVSAHSIDDLEHFKKQMEVAGLAAVRAGDMTADAFNRAMEQISKEIGARKQFASYESDLRDFAGSAAGSKAFYGDKGLDPLARAYQKAASDNSEQAERAAREILAANAQLVGALGATGVEDALKRLKGLAEKTVSGNDVKLPPINFGPSTFHIVQDLRGQDADAVAVELRRDVTRSATSRVGSRLQTPFGY